MIVVRGPRFIRKGNIYGLYTSTGNPLQSWTVNHLGPVIFSSLAIEFQESTINQARTRCDKSRCRAGHRDRTAARNCIELLDVVDCWGISQLSCHLIGYSQAFVWHCLIESWFARFSGQHSAIHLIAMRNMSLSDIPCHYFLWCSIAATFLFHLQTGTMDPTTVRRAWQLTSMKCRSKLVGVV